MGFNAGSRKRRKKMALENNEIDSQGRPMITVIADGAWSKRSYKSNYSSKSGVAAIVGYRTKKLLYLGVKNKYCSTCTLSGEKFDHFCYKNYSAASTSMESSIIVEGFKNSISMHGLVFKYLVADGDSSVYKKILESRPYGNTLVEKIECRNHLLRSFCNSLRNLTTKRFSADGKLIPPYLRNKLKDNILRLRTAVD